MWTDEEDVFEEVVWDTLTSYTNAGKSSLLNTLSHSSLFTENRLFATLDPATREVWLGDGARALITDTVGFIKRLPPTLIASFRSTLEEVKEADLLMHVADIASDDVIERIEVVERVLKEIDADSLPVLYVFNKVDLLPDVGNVIDTDKVIEFADSNFSIYIQTSAKTGENVEDAFLELTRRMIPKVR